MKRSAISFGRRDGQAVILVVLAMSIFLIAALGLAIDGAQMYAHRQMAQVAADAAAQAGILSILRGTNSTSTYPFGTGPTPIASSVCTTTDGRTPCVYARNNGFGGTAADTVTLSFPATVSGVTLSSVAVPAFAVAVQRTLQTGLIRFAGGPATSAIVAKAVAGLIGTGSSACIYALSPTGQKAFTASGGAAVAITGCAIAVNSTSSDALDISGGSTSVTASAINVTGGDSVSGGATASPTPVTGTAAVADPFAPLPSLSPASCATHPTTYNPPNGSTLSPGTYCGGINVSGGSVTFASGTYIINGGGLTFSGGASASGSGVMFYLTGTNSTYQSLTVSGGSSIMFSAQTSGTYLGMLFFQDRSITSNRGANFSGGSSIALTGSLYFPTTTVTYSGGSGGGPISTIAIVAQQITFSGASNIEADPTGALTGLSSKSVALVQ